MTIASGLTIDGRGFAVLGGHAYFGNSGSLVSVPTDGSTIDGGVLTVVAANATPAGIAVDSANVYWTDGSGSVMQVPVGGGTANAIAGPPGSGFPWGIAIDGTSVYWANYDASGAILKVPIGGGAETMIASAEPNLFSVAVDGVNVYWAVDDTTNSGRVLKAPVGGGTATLLAPGPNQPQYVATDGTNVYWTTASAIPSEGTVMKVSVNGGASTTLASGRVFPEFITVDTSNVYWIDTGHAVSGDAGGAAPSLVMAVPIGGGVPITLATGPTSPSGYLQGIAFDAVAVYWIELGSGGSVNSSVMRVAKP